MGSISSLGLLRDQAVFCCLRRAKSYSLLFPFSSVHKEQIQMGSDTSVPAVVRDRQAKERTRNHSASKEFLHKKILLLEHWES